MTSARRIAANRRNAQKSCGPRTPAGKAQVRRNALDHGLSVSILKSPGMSAEVERLARALIGSDQEGALLGQARKLAEAEMDLQRIQLTKVALLNVQLAQFKGSNTSAPVEDDQGRDEVREFQRHEDEVHSKVTAEALVITLPQLAKLQRYEDRARSRWMRAMQNLAAQKMIARR